MGNPAESYENYVVPVLFEPWAKELTSRVAPREGDRIVDVASGTGIVARCVARTANGRASVTGVDPNPNFLAVAKQAAEREGLQIEFHECRAESLPFDDGSFDLAFCQQGVQFFGDRQAGVNEIARMLADEGRVGISTWQSVERHDFFHALHKAMQQHLGTPAAAAPFGLSDHRELGSLLSGAGLQDVEVTQASKTSRYPNPERFLDETLAALIAVIAPMLDMPDHEIRAGVEAVTKDLQEPLEAFTEDDHVVLGWHSNVATARK